MDVFEIVYIAVGTVLVLVILHLTTFWVARVIQPPKPKIVYVQSPQAAPAAAPVAAPVLPPVVPTVAPVAPPLPPPPAILSEQPTKIQLPTYDVPASSTPSTDVPKMGSLPPPIETRSTTKQSSGDLGPPR